MNYVRAWEEPVTIPTYEVGRPEKNPIFIDKRVYQGSSGRVYPYPTIEELTDNKVDKLYHAVWLENRYLKVMILPELGGRIQRAYDKTNDYDFVYYNHVIKPALVGLCGPWISGGIEFNWPQHHRPNTYMPVDHMICENSDGSCSVLINDVDRINGTKAIARFTLYPDKAYIEISGQLYNRTPLSQTFLWWANPAVAVNDHTQSIFPPDVTAVMDHGKRDVSRFPIATGEYYKFDYSAGVDISRYKNIPVPTSYMAAHSDYDFVGGYDHQKRAGILHIADHHISPGKKQWTWGCGEFGKAWDRNLTDEDGPYVELMTGVYTDNQPDFTWLKPFEEKTFTQYFMPYKAVGSVKNATIKAAVNLEAQPNGVYICVYATAPYEDATITLLRDGKQVYSAEATLSPDDVFEELIPLKAESNNGLSVAVTCGSETLVEYTAKEKAVEKLPDPAEAAKDPAEIMTNEELYLTGLHIEQYRHATYRPDPYYLEGLKRDPGDARINVAYGALLMRRGQLGDAEGYFRKAIERLTGRNPNPYDSEAYYFLGLTLFHLGRDDEAFDAFYKATWTNEQQEMSFYFLAAIECRRGNYAQAVGFIERSLIKNTHNVKARGLKQYLLRKLGRTQAAAAWLKESLVLDPFDFVSLHERTRLDGGATTPELNRLMRDSVHNYLCTIRDLAQFGAYEDALALLSHCPGGDPLAGYYEGWLRHKCGRDDEALESIKAAEKCDPYCCFPNTLEDIAVLEYAAGVNPNGAMAYYYLGCIFCDKQQPAKAQALWERSTDICDTYPTALRNLALVSYNHAHDAERARALLERAFELDVTDARVLMELDQLYSKLGISADERLKKLSSYPDTVRRRDDLYTQYIALHNILGMHEKALDLIAGRKFHPWEGGEGKITTQYTVALVELAKQRLAADDPAGAERYLNRALVYPENLSEGRLAGTKDNHIYYYLGLALERQGRNDEARARYELASVGTMEPAGMMYYNDQPADMILYQGLACRKLGLLSDANARFYRLLDYGEQHYYDKMRIAYFAISLPDFLIFEDDLDRRNRAHCHFLIALANIGLGKRAEAAEHIEAMLGEDQSHLQGLLISRQLGSDTAALLA